MNDQLGTSDRQSELPAGMRIAAKALCILAAAALVIVVALLVQLQVVHNRYQSESRANEAVAVQKASADAQSFYRQLLSAAESGPLTQQELRSLSKGRAVVAQSPVDQGDLVLVDFSTTAVYVEAGTIEGSGTVDDCYVATLPAPGAKAPGSLRQIVCPAPKQW